MHPRREPYRLRLLTALELLWATGVTREGLVRADVTDLAPDQFRIRLWVNPPGRTEPEEKEFKLSRPAQAAVRLWLPVRREVIRKHLREGPDHQALFITLRHTKAEPASGTPRMIPPGVRITGSGLETSYSNWARWLNGEHADKPGWPVPTDLYLIARGGRDG
jgi:integrase